VGREREDLEVIHASILGELGCWDGFDATFGGAWINSASDAVTGTY
jgi:hypothetical protein